ncbi:MAG TPA: cold shock domain-containing protein [Prolixibacteraceae bacterium]|jgi:cold shock CspA family protein|nr:cold shock domain-containing protein [Prolixibacteraceae bacterium]HQN94121.1 cold shock domain-containing protein [Prolixibacteraceae bacterium]HUM88826.1 cold shock domain-containing protein [Prolixibacteraceae bacterium]
MGRSQESFNKKEVRKQKEKKRKEKTDKKLARKETGKTSFDDMIAYVDEFGQITATPPDPDKKIDIDVEDIEIGISKADPSLKADPTRKGIVTFFNSSKGYGFITDMETRQSVFVHVNNLLESIKENNVVNYEVVKGVKGPTAIKVKLFRKEQPQ